MAKGQRFFICEHCGNMVGFIADKGVPLVCCGVPMGELVSNTEEASFEKHIPSVTVNGNEINVKVGSVLHPMEEAHHISFIYVETERGGQRKSLKAGESPEASFVVVNDKATAVYAYCNLHGMWKAEVK